MNHSNPLPPHLVRRADRVRRQRRTHLVAAAVENLMAGVVVVHRMVEAEAGGLLTEAEAVRVVAAAVAKVAAILAEAAERAAEAEEAAMAARTTPVRATSPTRTQATPVRANQATDLNEGELP
jgi:hypothetical protein